MGSNYLRRLRSLERPREDDDALDPESDSLSESESDDLDDLIECCTVLSRGGAVIEIRRCVEH